MSTQLSVSVIIPTKHRPEDLEAAVKSVFQQSTAPFEVIIIDQSQTPESRQRVEQIHAQLPGSAREKIPLRYVWDDRIPGLIGARMMGMELARGEIWLFLDDDVILEQSFLEELVSIYHSNPGAGGVSGIITNYEPPHWTYRLWLRVFARGPFRDERQWIYWNADRLRNAQPIAVTKLGGGLMSFRAEVVRDIRLDGSLRGVPEGEDIEFCARLAPGTLLLIAPRARLVHKKTLTSRADDYWLERYAYANRLLYETTKPREPWIGVYFAWLVAGCGLVALLASLKKLSLNPLRALLQGIRGERTA